MGTINAVKRTLSDLSLVRTVRGNALRTARNARLALSKPDMLTLSRAQRTCVASRVVVGKPAVLKRHLTARRERNVSCGRVCCCLAPHFARIMDDNEVLRQRIFQTPGLPPTPLEKNPAGALVARIEHAIIKIILRRACHNPRRAVRSSLSPYAVQKINRFEEKPVELISSRKTEDLGKKGNYFQNKYKLQELELQYSPSRWSNRFSDPSEVINHHCQVVTAASERVKSKVPYEAEISYGQRQGQKLDIFGGTHLSSCE
uniref:Uncharacterized protein n=1 Tax=Timema bartmani TaxID=61472 RepID=A0A7R9EV86_9NEOP|nr:unnamed protein product [Timema bartmani]